ncbi:MAG: DUF4139 domain-containing protein, partial [Leptolyngbyaceae bacterium]|nr:DUF4139 domain-containing protein [Leptolyngbyaceae bacterium]
ASTARETKEHELRKTVVICLSPVPARSLKVILEYFVPGARWTPAYVCRLDSRANTAAIAVRALICQRTGEDWSGVRLELSTAEPLAWCELPELPSLRLGRVQAVPQKSGWRSPPVGAESLFEDFDQQQTTAKAALIQSPDLSTVRVSSVSISPLPPLESNFPQAQTADLPAPEQYFGTGAMSIEKRGRGTSIQIENDEFADLDALLGSAPGGLRDQAQAMPPPAPAAYAPGSFVRGRAASPSKGVAQAKRESRREEAPAVEMEFQVQETITERLAYGLMRLGAAENRDQRGKLAIAPQRNLYIESLQHLNVTIQFDVLSVVQLAVSNAQSCLSTSLPPGSINVRTVAGSFDYAYRADGRVDVPSDGQFHSIALTSQSTDVNLRYVVVPREDTNVFRIAQLRNPLQAPLLAGSTDVYVDGEYILSTMITTVPPQGQMELGLGVEQGIKVARNISYQEARSGKILVAFNELCHQIQIAIANNLGKPARLEVRERVPIPQEGAKVDVHIDQVSPAWEKYEQVEREAPIQGGYRWQVQVPAGEQTTLSAQYTIKTYADSEVIGGNRREA